ncbi:MAG: hypothetical protein HY360_22935 [Verrucomicrobia bacterium]|nr:hypothetical protein [Verrucomicrobiota bacterium]
MALTPNDEQMLKAIYQRLADRPLKPDDDLYEPIYTRPEGEDPVAKLKTQLEWATVESLQMFSGFRGTGKTTELFRLRRELEAKGHLVLYADALEYLSPSEEIDITTMLMGVAGAFGEQLRQTAGANAVAENFWQRIGNYLTRTTVEVIEVSPKVEVSTPAKALVGDLKAGLDLKVALKTAPTFRHRLQDFLANRLGELKKEVNAFVEEGVKAVRKAKNNPDLTVVFLFDQFEQVRGSRSNEQAVIRSVERLFSNHLELLRLPYVHVIYTVPPWLQFVLPGAFGIETLPCVRLWNNDAKRTRYETSWTHLREVIVKRFGTEGFERIIGKGPAGQTLADRLIAMSGGHFRDLLRLFRETIVLIQTWRPSLPVAFEVLERAIVNVRNEYLPIATEDARWLAEIEKRRDPALPNAAPESIGRLSRFLDTHLVLYLTNGEDWYDIHPLIRDEVNDLAKLPLPKKV